MHSNKLLFCILLTHYILCTSLVSGKKNKNAGNSPVVIQSESDEPQEISIRVGKASDIGIMEDGDNNDDDESNQQASSSNYFQSCGADRTCCFQYTWPGFMEEDDIPTTPANATCAYLREDRRYEDMACFDPIVYTTRTEGSEPLGNAPNVTRLRQLALQNNWNVFCSLTQQTSCVSLKYFNRGDGNKIRNETKFCGRVIDTGSEVQRTNGCYRETGAGFIREVCVCRNSFCNSAEKISSISTISIVIFAILALIFNDKL